MLQTYTDFFKIGNYLIFFKFQITGMPASGIIKTQVHPALHNSCAKYARLQLQPSSCTQAQS